MRAIRARLLFIPLPTFTFTAWLCLLTIGVVSLALLSPLAFRGTRSMKYLAYPYAVVMIQHEAVK